eukprot:TRINITY_DN228_c0_g1_i2.p1 TRINITY_DN228_c0_g1~~TRINITY_DN228_c0_g1_i2.p1  ORF type:complete len:383 (+),score=45.55 TRINITY_DN228_c0_g1_i2:101-1249(+)
MGPYLSQPKKDKNYSFGRDKRNSVRYYSCGMQGWRKSMEDAHMNYTDLNDKYSLFGVFDGHGGSEVARFCERHFPKVLLQKLEQFPNDAQKALNDSFLEMDQLLRNPKHFKELKKLKSQAAYESGGAQENEAETEEANESFEQELQHSCSFVGCTANVVLLDNVTQELIIANAGDAKCVLMRQGHVKELTIDHKPEDVNEKLRIEKAGGQIFGGRVNGNINVSRSIGDLGFKNDENLGVNEQLIIPLPDITTEKFLGQGIEFLVLGCDGVWEKMGCEFVLKSIEEGIQNRKSVRQIIEELFDQLISPSYQENPKGCDNMSMVIVLNNTPEIQALVEMLESDYVPPLPTEGEQGGKAGKTESKITTIGSETFIETVGEKPEKQ